MTDTGVIGLILMVINVAFSYKGFTHAHIFEKYTFEVDRVLVNKEYQRLITSGFLHVSWTHLIFNMLSLYAFSGLLESQLGGFYFLLLYLASLVGGNLLALFIHRHHGDYSAVGASGAVCGVMFASIALSPGMGIGFFFLPFSIPSWLYGMLYVAYSIYGIRSRRDNIGHEAHLGGAFIGMLLAIIIHPQALIDNYFAILVTILPTLAFIYLIITRPDFLLLNHSPFKPSQKYYTIEDKYNEKKAAKQRELDNILDKIHKKGMDGLSSKERQKLEEYADKK